MKRQSQYFSVRYLIVGALHHLINTSCTSHIQTVINDPLLTVEMKDYRQLSSLNKGNWQECVIHTGKAA